MGMRHFEVGYGWVEDQPDPYPESQPVVDPELAVFDSEEPATDDDPE